MAAGKEGGKEADDRFSFFLLFWFFRPFLVRRCPSTPACWVCSHAMTILTIYRVAGTPREWDEFGGGSDTV